MENVAIVSVINKRPSEILNVLNIVTVMASLSVYSVSEPLGLTLGSQCALETVKRDLLFDELLFGAKQLKQKSRQNWQKYFTNQCFLFKFGITEDRCISILQEKPKRKNLRVSTCCSKVRDLSPHTSQQGNPGLIPTGKEK